MKKDELNALRNAFADYVASEDCSCCRNIESHDAAAERMAILLDVPRYKDDSGWNFRKFASRKEL